MFGNSNKKELKTISGVLQETNKTMLIMYDDLQTVKAELKSLKKEVLKNRKTEIVEVEVSKKRKKRKPNLRTTRGFTKISEEEVKEFKKLYDQGLSMLEISMQTGRSSSAIGRKLHDLLDGTND